MRRASAPPRADAQSSGSRPKTAKKMPLPRPPGGGRTAAPQRQCSSGSRPLPWADNTTGPIRSASAAGSAQRISTSSTSMPTRRTDGTRTMSFAVVTRRAPCALGVAAQPFEFRDAEAVVIGKRSCADENGAERSQCREEFFRPPDPGEGQEARAGSAVLPSTGASTARSIGTPAARRSRFGAACLPLRRRSAPPRRRGRDRGAGSRAADRPGSLAHCRTRSRRRRRSAQAFWQLSDFGTRHRAGLRRRRPRPRRGRRRLGRGRPSTARAPRAAAPRRRPPARRGGSDRPESARGAGRHNRASRHAPERRARASQSASASATGVLPAPPATRLPTHTTGTGGR